MKPTENLKRYVTVTEISKLFAVHNTTVHYWAKRKDFPKNLSTSNTRIFLTADVIAWARLFGGYEVQS